MDLKAITEIDHNALDVEWVNHPKVFMEVSSMLVMEKLKLKKLTMRLDVKEADALKEIQEAPENFGFPKKPTIPEVKAAVAVHEDVKAIRKKLIDQEYEVNMLSACVSSLEHKKRALESLVTLHGQNYFSGPSVARDLEAEVIGDAQKRKARRRGKGD